MPDSLVTEARAALLEITPDSTIGELVSSTPGEDGLVTVLFESALPGYPGWKWTVSLTQLDGAAATVLETELVPGEGALLAPDWLPWSDRLAEYKAAQAETDALEAGAAVAATGEGADELGDDSDDEDYDADLDDDADSGDDSDDDDDDSDDDDDDDDDDSDEDDDDDLGSDVLHAGDLDGVDIDSLDVPDTDDDDADDDPDDDESDFDADDDESDDEDAEVGDAENRR